MSVRHDCDECGERIGGDPIELAFWVDVDDEDEAVWNEWHLCSWGCVSAFGMTQAVEGMGADDG